MRWAEQVTGKKVVLAVVLHANPDKFNGTAVLKKRGIRVVTSEQVRALIPSVHEKRLRAFYDRYKPDYPQQFTLPESLGDKTTELKAAGLTLKVHVLGPGCSEAHLAVEFDGHLFVGDLVAGMAHSWLEIGRTDEWLKRLGQSKLKPAFVHPGRGPSGDERLLTQQEAYLKAVIAAVAAEKPTLPLDEKAEQALERIKASFRTATWAIASASFWTSACPPSGSAKPPWPPLPQSPPPRARYDRRKSAAARLCAAASHPTSEVARDPPHPRCADAGPRLYRPRRALRRAQLPPAGSGHQRGARRLGHRR